MATPKAHPPTYFHNGQALSSPPLSARIRSFMDSAYVFAGLYLTTLFSLDAYAAAEASPFNSRNKTTGKRTGWGFGLGGGRGGGGGGGGGGGPGGPGGGGPSRKLGRVDDIRGPECKSCG